MRIVQLANFVGPSSGGLRVAVTELGARYALAGHDVIRITPGHQDEIRTVDGVEVHTIQSPRLPLAGGYRAVVDQQRVSDLVGYHEPDAIELSDKTTLVGAARLAGRSGSRIILMSHERLDAILSDRVGRVPLQVLTDSWNRRLVAVADVITCASDFAADEFHRIGATNVTRVPLGVDLDTFSPRGPRLARCDPPTIVVVGRLSREKRPMTAIHAVRCLASRRRRVRLRFVGDGPERGRLERASRGLDVEFLGHVHGRAALAAVLRDADVVLAPSPHETFGLAVLECLASGIPAVVPAIGALPELIAASGAGEIVADDPVSYAEALDRVLAGAPGPLAAAARARAEGFHWDRTAEAMLRLFAGRPAVSRLLETVPC